MDEIEVRIPICCPKCGLRALTDVPIAVVVIGLTSMKTIRLHASCCSMTWQASPEDLQSIRSHVGERWLERQCQWLEAETQLVNVAPQA